MAPRPANSGSNELRDYQSRTPRGPDEKETGRGRRQRAVFYNVAVILVLLCFVRDEATSTKQVSKSGVVEYCASEHFS